MMKRFRWLVVLLAMFVVSASVSAQDVVCPMPPCEIGTACPMIECMPPIQPGVFTNPDWLKVDHHRVNVTIDNQIATTEVDLEFVNEGNGLAEGTFVFPLPANSAVEELIMYIDGVPIEAKILDATEARSIYNEIVRQYRDPALLEYVGMQAIQANVFPIPPGDSRRIEIRYSQALEVDNGLVHLLYPLDVTSLTARRNVELASVSVDVRSNDPISNVYSPSHNVAISRDSDGLGFTAGFEQSNFLADQDFSLYYGISSDTISLNMLSYRESANEDGFFMLMVQPPLELPPEMISPRDMIIVLDQSGSMDGEKWEQAQEAAIYVLENLNANDRFNVVLFSTGVRVFSNSLETPDQAGEAADWIRNMYAEGGTNISEALNTALTMADDERTTTVLFMTDGLATEGETETSVILEQVADAAPANIRLFTFGVGDDVDTFLLDALVRDYRGASSYVRPTERIDEEVASLLNKIGSPALTNLRLEIGSGDVVIDTVYPQNPLPDLFAGNQLTIVGRYHGAADATSVTLTGDVMVNGVRETRSYVYDNVTFRDRAGGESFVARLWATRRIGDLLNSIRLNGEDPELVNSIINLSVRYGIITPYTSFLIEEDDILTQTGRQAAEESLNSAARDLSQQASGAGAVQAADEFAGFAEAEAPMAMPTMGALQPAPGVGGEGGELSAIVLTPMDMDDSSVDSRGDVSTPIQNVGDKTFLNQNGIWTDTTFVPETMQPQQVVFLSDEYFALLDTHPELAEYFAVGDQVIVVLDGVAYQVVLA